MKNKRQIFKKSILMSAFLLSFCTSAFAVINWGGTYGNPAAFTANQTITDNVVLHGNVTVTINSGVTVIISGVISSTNASYTFTKAGGGELRLSGANTYPGQTIINQGILAIGNDGKTGAVAGNIVVNGTYLNFRRTDTYIYSKVISGAGTIQQAGGEGSKTILTGDNTCTGPVKIITGTLQIGDGTSGSINSTSKVEIGSGKILRFEPGDEMIFNKVISGAGGKVEYKGSTTKKLRFTEDNTYTGTTTIEAGGDFIIGNNTAKGDVKGNIINNGTLRFYHSGSYTYSGVISGTGDVYQWGDISSSILTLGGVNTYTGKTYTDGPLVLSATGSIESSSEVILTDYAATKFNISAGNKKIKNLNSRYFNAEVILGASILTIGTAGENDGAGDFAGKFTGTGGVIKTGNGTFIMSGANTTTGLFALNQGKVEFSNKWAGDFNIATGATLDVIREVTVGKTFNMLGGNIYMNLTTTPPSKIIATDAASAAGTNTLHIASGEVTNHIIMQAASGLNTTDPYTLNMPGYTASLTATGTLLLLTATVTDITPPVITTETLPNGTVGTPYFATLAADSEVSVTWSIASGVLPAGLSLNPATGDIYGIPTTEGDFPFTVKATNKEGGGSDTKALTIKIGGVGIEQLRMTNDELRVYPNPTTLELRVTSDELQVTSIEVFDVMGRRHECTKARMHEGTKGLVMDISAFPAGIYFLRVETDKGIVMKKVIKSEL
jgi:autotransporter-associated beta strand protein